MREKQPLNNFILIKPIWQLWILNKTDKIGFDISRVNGELNVHNFYRLLVCITGTGPMAKASRNKNT